MLVPDHHEQRAARIAGRAPGVVVARIPSGGNAILFGPRSCASFRKLHEFQIIGRVCVERQAVGIAVFVAPDVFLGVGVVEKHVKTGGAVAGVPIRRNRAIGIGTADLVCEPGGSPQAVVPEGEMQRTVGAGGYGCFRMYAIGIRAYRNIRGIERRADIPRASRALADIHEIHECGRGFDVLKCHENVAGLRNLREGNGHVVPALADVLRRAPRRSVIR
ncbi:Uncharacterised protein [Candidatus Norongarragalina meridionalis]|nr:Uncharacterised protein [Candidatus Norongarragalina meridionalis]